MFINSLKYPLKLDEDLLRTLIIGTLLVIGSILIIPAFILIGYFVQTIHNASKGEIPPRFENYLQLFIDGLKPVAVFLVYMIVLGTIMLITVMAGAINETLGTVFFLVLSVPAYFGLIYIYLAILHHLGQNKDVMDAFRIKEILKTAFNFRYLKAFILVVILIPLLFGVLQFALAITVIGIILIPATLLYEFIVYSKIIGAI